MPLGILLAAAWVEMLTPREIAVEISQSIDFLEADWRDAPERQRSIRAVYNHSWNLLAEREREVFQGLSVFRGGFTREAAQAVTGATLRELRALVSKSLVQHTPAPSAMLRTGGRYEVHELLRQYADEKLNQSPVTAEATRDRHAAYYAAALQQWYGDMRGPYQQAAFAEMDADIENVRAAWNWAVERGQVERLDQGIDGLVSFHMWRKRFPEVDALCHIAVQRLSEAETQPPADAADRPVLSAAEGPAQSRTEVRVEGLRVLSKILAWQSWLESIRGKTERIELLQNSLDLLERPELADVDTRPERAFVLTSMARAGFYPDYAQVRQVCQRSLALYETLDDRASTALALENWGYSAINYGMYGEAKQALEKSLAIRKELGDRLGMATVLLFLSWPTLVLGQFERAERYARESLAIRQELLGAPVAGLQAVGWAVAHRGRYDEARSLLEKSVAAFDAQGAHHWSVQSHAWLDLVEVHLGRYAQARERGQMCLAHFRKIGRRSWTVFVLAALGMAALGSGKPEEAWQLLRESATIHEEIAELHSQIWALPISGYAARGLGHLFQAQQRFCQTLQMAAESQDHVAFLYTLPGVALLLADRGERARAVELYALASRYPFVANSRWFEDVAGKHVAAAEALPPEVVVAAQERGRARDPWTTAEELLIELENGE
jgi:tetratricopeptide (TPR) repeat protein